MLVLMPAVIAIAIVELPRQRVEEKEITPSDTTDWRRDIEIQYSKGPQII